MSNANTNTTNDEKSVPDCTCKECARVLTEIKDFNSHLSKMYSNLNGFSRSIDAQNEALSRIFKDLIPLLKANDSMLKQNQAMLTKLTE